MGIFDTLFAGKEKRLAAENELKQKIAQAAVLDGLISAVMTDEKNEWIRKEQGSSDNRRRAVKVTTEGVEFKWSTWERVRDQSGEYKSVENIIEEAVYNFHDNGFAPLGPYRYDTGKNDVLITGVVCRLFAELVKERLAAKIPKGKFDEKVNEYHFFATFYYTLPDRELKSMF